MPVILASVFPVYFQVVNRLFLCYII